MPDNLNFFLTMQFYRSLACDPRAFLTAICTLRVLSCCLFVCLLFVLVQHVSLVLIKPKGLIIIYRRGGGEQRGGAQDLWRWIIVDLPFECYFPEVILLMTFTIPPSPPPPTICLHFPSKFEWSPLWIVPKFSAIPPFGFSVTTDPRG